MHKNQKILFDAQAIIDLHTWRLWERLVNACIVCVSSIIREEAYFHSGKQSINLQPKINEGKIEVVTASVQELDEFRNMLSDQFLFCTADAQAIKCLGILALGKKRLSMESLLKMQKIRYDLPYSRREKYFRNYLDKRFIE